MTDYRRVVGAMHRLELLRKIKSRGILSASGLHSGQPPMLMYIINHPGCTQKEAADELDVTAASAAASLKRLEKAGLVARRPDPHDARRNCLYITPAGQDRVDKNREQFEALDQAMFSGLSEEEVQSFQRICEKMFDNLADESCRHLTICKLARQLQGDKPNKEV